MNLVEALTPSWLKVALVVLTGALGILGFFVDHKDRTNRWRWLVLVGIVLSAALGAVSQHLSDQAEALKTQALLEKAATTIDEVERSLTSIDGIGLWASFKVSCEEPRVERFCASVTESSYTWQSPPNDWRLWPLDPNGHLFYFWIDIFAKGKHAADWKPQDGLSKDLTFWINVDPQDVGGLRAIRSGDTLTVIFDLKLIGPARIPINNGVIRRRFDLVGDTVLVGHSPQYVVPKEAHLKLRDGEEIAVLGLSPYTLPAGGYANQIGILGYYDIKINSED